MGAQRPRRLISFPIKHSLRSIAGRYLLIRVAYGPITALYKFIKNASWIHCPPEDTLDPTECPAQTLIRLRNSTVYLQ